ncbi:MAG: SpaH/EbpB family LPXTG-anchored major pilin [Actinomycetota bacterium]
MATNKKGLTARIAAGFGAVALATLTVLGGALPASAVAVDNIDPAEPRALTIHKFAEPETPTTLAHDGTELDEAALTGLTPLPGVTFTIQQVKGIDLTTAAGWTAAANPAPTPDSLAAADLEPAVTGITNADGEIRFPDLAAAVYLVTETDPGENNIAFEAEPFLVTVPMPVDNTWVYDVHVYPKNAITGIEKSFENGLTASLGDRATWTLDADVPEIAAAETLSSFVITDTLDSRLTYGSATVTGTNVALVPADYAVVNTGQLVTVTFTPAGVAKLAAANNASVQVDIVSTVVSLQGAAPADNGIIKNGAQLIVNGTKFDSNIVTTEWGTLAILKYEQRADAADHSGVLAGAEFQIFANEADRDARTNPISVGGQSTFVTQDNGIAFIPVLPSGTYWIVETKAPAGYVVSTTPIGPVTIVTGDLSPTSVDVSVANAQVPAYALPITGGSGQAAFMIGGAGLLASALGFALFRRRKADAEV